MDLLRDNNFSYTQKTYLTNYRIFVLNVINNWVVHFKVYFKK